MIECPNEIAGADCTCIHCLATDADVAIMSATARLRAGLPANGVTYESGPRIFDLLANIEQTAGTLRRDLHHLDERLGIRYGD